MRILVLNYEFPPVGGGGGRASADLAAALAQRGHEIRVLTTHAPRLPRRERRDGYEVLRVFTGRRSYFRASFAAMSGFILAATLPALRQVRTWKPDVVHTHFAVPTGAVAYVLRRLTGVPYVLTVHLGDVPGGVPEKTNAWFRMIGPLTPPVWRAASAVVAVSEYTRRLALRRYDVPIRVIPNGVTLPPWNGPARSHCPPRLIFAGRFQPQKNVDLLAEALARLQDVDWTCALLGDGPLRPRVEATLESAGVRDRVYMPGWVRSEQVWERLGESDVLVLPSRSEGLPVVGVQALALGVAIVGTRAGGLEELVQDGVNGRLCEVGDVQGLVEALRWCLQDGERLARMKEASRQMADRYDMKRVAAEYEELFREVAGGG